MAELATTVSDFLKTNPYAVGTKRNPETRHLIYYLVSVADVPPCVAAIAGEVLQSLRSALDLVAYQLVLAGNGKPGAFDKISYPIFASLRDYEAGKAGRIPGLSKPAIKVVDATKPYKGGNDPLWQIHKLNIVDKHRLMLTVGSRFQSLDLGYFMSRQMREAFPERDVPTLSTFLRPADSMFPLKAGDELFIDAQDAEQDDNLQFRFGVP
jgi:hypothetical protein